MDRNFSAQVHGYMPVFQCYCVVGLVKICPKQAVSLSHPPNGKYHVDSDKVHSGLCLVARFQRLAGAESNRAVDSRAVELMKSHDH